MLSQVQIFSLCYYSVTRQPASLILTARRMYGFVSKPCESQVLSYLRLKYYQYIAYCFDLPKDNTSKSQRQAFNAHTLQQKH